MQIRGLEKITHPSFTEALRNLRASYRQKAIISKALHNIRTYGNVNGKNFKDMNAKLEQLNGTIAQQKEVVRSFLPEGVVDAAVESLKRLSSALLRQLEVFSAWNIESYRAGSQIEYLQSQFVRENYPLVQEYTIGRIKLHDEKFMFDLDDLRNIDELIKFVEEYEFQGGRNAAVDLSAELALRISSDIRYPRTKRNTQQTPEEF